MFSTSEGLVSVFYWSSKASRKQILYMMGTSCAELEQQRAVGGRDRASHSARLTLPPLSSTNDGRSAQYSAVPSRTAGARCPDFVIFTRSEY